MQQIRKLELVGFKSFVDRTQLVFSEGITAIVGPNGCGKSNIADAISWVVGEQSARSLRTDRMEGVIFSGTQARKATSMAEVVLTMSLPRDFAVPEGLSLNPEDFSVGRRLYRSGESEYYLDGRRCRLKDIQALFEGTGLGPNSYALIEQGRISQILSSKPADRRSLIEEAARITLFKSRRYSAEAKLELAQQNLVRVNDISREVKRQLNSMRRQAARARRYGRMREELRSVQRLRLGLEHRRLTAALGECAERLQAARERERLAMEALANAEDLRSRLQEGARRTEAEVNELRDRVSRLRVELGNTQGLRESLDSQRMSLMQRIGDFERERLAVEERRALVEREQERLRKALGAIGEEIARERETLEAEQARAAVVRDSLADTECEIESLRSLLLNGAGQLSDLRNIVIRCQENINRIAARLTRLEAEQEAKAQERKVHERELEQFRHDADVKASRQREVARQTAEAERRLGELSASMESLASELNALQEEHSLVHHRLSSLEEIERRRSNYSEGVQKFLSTQLPGEDQRMRQTLADHVDTDPPYEAAVEDYLNDQLQYILVEDLGNAVENVERVKRIGAGKCTFMTLRNGHNGHPAEHRPPLSGEGVIGYLDDLLRMRDDVKLAFERVLPEYASTVLVTDLDTAFRLAETHQGANFLTITGESYSPRGVLSAVGERKSMAGFLALKREKRELTAKLSALRGRLEGARAELARLKGEHETAAESLKTLAQDSRRLEVEAVVIQHEVARLEGEVAKLDQNEAVTALEISELLSERAEFETSMSAAQASLLEIEERSRTGDDELKLLAGRLESLRSENARLSSALAELLSAHAVKQERKAGLEAERDRLAKEAESVRLRAEDVRLGKAAAESRTEELLLAHQEAEARLGEYALLIKVAEDNLALKQNELSQQRSALDRAEETMRDLHADREQSMEARGAIEVENARIENDLGHLELGCQDEFHAPIGDVLCLIAAADWERPLEEVTAHYDGLRAKIENFGAINMRALEEYRALEERHQFLERQRTDVERSVADTQEAIAEISRRSIQQFQEAFTRIRENFIDVFQILFRGGQCDLQLLDECDVLESAIDIIAQPPGKRLQNILLLSGGEKALTALALLIAVFRYRPSPFCVLDEVDAPLDDANVVRFTKLLTELSQDTQFIVITHNKRTMEIAQALYGVTMEEPGVSKIVGVDLRTEAMAS
ncbi:MAG: chromosome segregation protein SMC [Acidobacteria bacterium]|nr:chromosome segregation protein SMC [Acidobacteriota bacterium]